MNYGLRDFSDPGRFMSREDIMESLSNEQAIAFRRQDELGGLKLHQTIEPLSVEPIRKFETGATRDTDNGKHDPEGFLSPLVINRFNEFMHVNRHQKDGSLRESDNWQKGIPLPVYAKSMWRHFLDFWLHHRGFGYKAKESMQVALCAIIFNAAGYLHELLKYENPNSNKATGQAGGSCSTARHGQANQKV